MQERYFEVMTKDVFMNQELYSDFMDEFESRYGKTELAIQRKPKLRSDVIILEIVMQKHELCTSTGT